MTFKEFYEKLKTPKKWLMWLIIFSSIIVIGFTLTLLVMGYDGWCSYVLYMLSAVGLTYIVFMIVINSKKMKAGVIAQMQKHKFTKNLLDDFGFRSVVFAGTSFVINILYTVFQALLAILSKSIWLGSLAVYNIAITAIRGWLVSRARKKVNKKEIQLELKVYFICGLLLLILNLALIPSIVLVVVNNYVYEYLGVLIYVMAAYAFYKLTMSAINIFKAKSNKDYIVQAIKNIGFADALVSIFALQTALIATFGTAGGGSSWANALSGGVILITIIAIGIYMVVKSIKETKKSFKGENNEQGI